MKKRIISAAIAAITAFSLAACGSSATATDGTVQQPASATEQATGNETEQIVLKVFSNLPDRTSGQGYVEQTLLNQYMQENPNVKIEVEALDDEGYKTKFKAYAAGNQMPDLVNIWGEPGFLSEVVDAGLLAELNQDDYADYGFKAGTLDGFSKDGKLYGLSRNTDAIGIYYNAQIFEDNNWQVPTTYEELLELGKKINAAGIIPLAIDGADKWVLGEYYSDILNREAGADTLEMTRSAIEKGDFTTDPEFGAAAELLRKTAESGLFEKGYESTDYGTAQNLFINGQSAMYYMGSWDMSIATNPDIDEAMRNNFHVFGMPTMEGGKGDETNINVFNAGGYAVTSNSANKEEAIKLLNYIMRPECWSKLGWETGACMSAQDFSQFETGKETHLQKEFMDMVHDITYAAGSSFEDQGTAEFKTICEDLTQELAIGTITVEEYLTGLEAACK